MRKTAYTIVIMAMTAYSSCNCLIVNAAPAQASGGGVDQSLYNSIAGHVNRGNDMVRRGNLAGALQEYEAAKAIEPNHPIVRQCLGECHNKMGISMYSRKQYPDAAAEFEKAISLGNAQARRNLGLCKDAMAREGVPDTPPEDDKPDNSKKPPEKAADAGAETKEDGSPKVVGGASGGGGATVSSGGQALYMSGSQMFPSYNSTPSGASTQTKPTNPAVKILPSSPPQASAAAPSSIAPGPVGSAPSAPGSAFDSTKAASNAAAVWPPVAGTPFASATPAAATPAVATPAVASPSATPTAVAVQSVSPTTPAAVPGDSTLSTPASSNPVAANPASTISANPTSVATSSENQSTDDKVSALEMKVYGKKNPSLPLMKRIEQLETDQFGQVRQGTMPERIENLKKAIGI